MRIAAVGLAVLALVAGSEPLGAQGDQTSIPEGMAYGVTVDRFGFGSEYSVGAATLHISSLRLNTLSSEFALSIFPRALAAMVLVTNVDLGGALNISLPSMTVLLRGGGTAFFALGGGAMALPGAHFGVSLLIRFAEKSGFRFDVVRRVYFQPGESSTPTLTIGVGITSLPGFN